MRFAFLTLLSIAAPRMMATPAQKFVAALRAADENPSMFFEKLGQLPRRRITMQQDIEIFLGLWQRIVDPRKPEIKVPGKNKRFIESRLLALGSRSVEGGGRPGVLGQNPISLGRKPELMTLDRMVSFSTKSAC